MPTFAYLSDRSAMGNVFISLCVSTSPTLYPTTSLKARARYFPALTGIRACAAYLVFFTHFNPFTKGDWNWKLLHEGNMGVTIFFVLSGFLICFRYLDRVELSGKWLMKYMSNRIARIYPMYFLVTALTFLFILIDARNDPTEQWPMYTALDKVMVIFLNFTFLRGFFEQFVFTGVAPGWTLTVEETFYLLAPLLLLGLSRVRQQYWLLLGYSVALLAFGSLAVLVLPHKYGLFISFPFMLIYTFFGRCIEFLVGMALALFI